MRSSGSFGLRVATVLAAILSAAPAPAELPGSTQPGATPVPPGNLIILRVVPPRNAIIPGAGRAVTAPTAPPSIVFVNLNGVGAPLSDAQAASVTGSIPAGQGGKDVASAIDGVFRSQSMLGGASADRSSASRAGGEIGAAVQSGMGALKGVFGALPGPGH